MRAIGGSWLTGLSGIPISRQLSRELKTQVVRPLPPPRPRPTDHSAERHEVPFLLGADNPDPRTHRSSSALNHPLVAPRKSAAGKEHQADLRGDLADGQPGDPPVC